MDDRTLLELAAKEAGIDGDYRWDGYGGGSFVALDGTRFNPLTDDGDALRLAVKLNMKIEQHYYEGDYYCRIYWDVLAYPIIEAHNKDPYAATRRAIVRAAAEIGKGME